MQQNIYENPEFFSGYYELRKRSDNYNDLLEQPAMRGLLPCLAGKTVLDLGCGFGRNCADFLRRGAKRVVGVDISQKMLDVARRESYGEEIEYINMSMTDIHALNEKFDFVYSSLAFHYIEDFHKLICDIYALLNDGGQLLFSQEHPVVTATKNSEEGGYICNERGEPVSYKFSNYNESGLRVISWFVDGVEKYHRTMGEILTEIADAGFIIEAVCETSPDSEVVKKHPKFKQEYIKPNFLIVRARK